MAEFAAEGRRGDGSMVGNDLADFDGTFLREVGGHIGYDVRRSRRREGHATAMLHAALPVAHRLGIDPALVSCDVDNVASRRTIEKAGGAFDDERRGKLRFWVPTGRGRSARGPSARS